jgi:predicted alpha/beta-fold hydrolase
MNERLMPTPINTHPSAHGSIIKSKFIPAWWCTNRHVQTMYPRFFQRRVKLDYRNERFTLPDGDFVNLAWVGEIATSKGLVVLFHGLEGSIRSHYANDMAANLQQQGYAVVLMHFRGCGGEPNLLPRAYHSGETQDAWYLLHWLDDKFPHTKKFAMGFSLGANMLLKMLGEKPGEISLQGAVAISPPFKLAQCSLSINQGFSRLYQAFLLKSMVSTLLKKMGNIDYQGQLKINQVQAKKLKSFREFDEHVTAPLHGFSGADDYYQQSSVENYMDKILTPTLILHAQDDPFMSKDVLPSEKDLSPSVRLELSEKGGHVGFMQGSPWQPRTWLHQRANDFISDVVSSTSPPEFNIQ